MTGHGPAGPAVLRVPKVVRMTGEPFERGLQHGAVQRDRLAGFLGDGLARLDDALGKTVRLCDLKPRLERFADEMSRQTPRLFRELEGMATSAGLSIDEAVLLQCRRELAGYSRFTTRGDCTTFARSGSAPMLAQTIDLAGDLDDHLCVMEIDDTARSRRCLVVSFTGLLGYLGVNDRGLAVGLNLVLGGDWSDGLPAYVAIRHLLDCCGSVEDAIECLSTLKLASSRCFVLCDGRLSAFVEAMDGRFKVRRADEVAHTNHFLDADFARRDELNVFAANASKARLAVCRDWLAAHPSLSEPERVFDFLRRPPVFVADHGERRREKTVGAVVIDPGALSLAIRCGDPSANPTRHFAIRDIGSSADPVPSRGRPGRPARHDEPLYGRSHD